MEIHRLRGLDFEDVCIPPEHIIGRVKSAYPGSKWQKKVDNMSYEQVIAVYLSLIRRGKLK